MARPPGQSTPPPGTQKGHQGPLSTTLEETPWAGKETSPQDRERDTKAGLEPRFEPATLNRLQTHPNHQETKVENVNEETVRAGNIVPSTGPRNPKRLDHTGARTRVLYVSESNLGIRVRHRYDKVLHAYVRDEVPKDAKRWDTEARCWIFDDGEYVQELFRRAKRRGWGIAVDDGTADTRRPVGVQKTWADSLGFDIAEENRPEVMLDVLAVLEKHEAQGVPGADKAARKLRDFVSWAC